MYEPPKLVIGRANPKPGRHIVIPTNSMNDDEYEYVYDYDEEEDYEEEEYSDDQFPGEVVNNFDESNSEPINNAATSPRFQISPSGKLLDIVIKPNKALVPNKTANIIKEGSNIIIKSINNVEEKELNNKPKLPEGVSIVLSKRGKLSEQLELQEYEKKREEYEEQKRIMEEKLNNQDPNRPKPSEVLPSVEQIDFNNTLTLNDDDYLFLCSLKSTTNTIEADKSKQNLSSLKTNLNISRATKKADIKIELPAGDKKAQLTYQQRANIPIFTNRKLTTSELKKHIRVEKNGVDLLQDEIDVFDNIDAEEEEEEEEEVKIDPKKPKIILPSVQLPKKGGEDIMHEVNLIGLDGKARNVKYIMLPNLNETKQPEINVLPRNEMQIEPLVLRHTFYTVSDLRKIKEDMLKNNLLATPVKRTSGLETLYRLQVEMKNPAAMKDYGFFRRGTLEISYQSLEPLQPVIRTAVTVAKNTPAVQDFLKNNQNQNQQQPAGPKLAQLQTVVQLADPLELIKTRKEQDKFIPTVFAKAVGLWDDKSEDAFKALTKKTFNRLTIRNVKETLESYSPELNTAERIDFAVSTFVKKAKAEPSFAPTYAQFAAQCSVQEFRLRVVQDTINSFFELLANPGKAENEIDVQDAVGASCFFASLIAEEATQEVNGQTAINQLLEAIEKPNPHSTHIEMLNKFIPYSGYEFVKKIDGSYWNRMEFLLKRNDIKQRYKFLITEIFEAKNKLMQGHEIVETLAYGKMTENMIQTVRDLFKEFKEKKELPENQLMPNDFFQAALEIIPEFHHTEQHNYYCFVADMCKYNGIYADDCVDIIANSCVAFEEKGLPKTYTQIWAAISDISIVLFLKGVIELRDCQEIHRIFNPGTWNYKNDIKWYLFDHHNFVRSLPAPGLDDVEIKTALSMPDLIRMRDIHIPVMSRLVAISICRALCAAIDSEAIMAVDKVPIKWLQVFAKAYRYQTKTVKDELVIFIRHYSEIPFSAGELIREFAIIRV
ncbi:MIF4G domain containing protein [Trichomonas vaginalis G3]|uniref:MIF4G domain containing protein n=1 Tax=Trichomonas vaginalis (strain ATCC PRA-98 / G3) TaxID=412133 RepID=A2D7E8_TRIV3|nr:armadillo (ARM) repeat-containing protein family [Trichomonas vaginalis G3]EAY23665.1 MIF4G domain containing protein [Trichomonas vaginalis G3]KAI5490157.1 armadillo (ARM) repeat-containing protein family [Trichomonas vaginalis G3]|eukprot:XP_001276913.1 MIF4G domain containing protein [Trichomonas vaginalis G3]